MGFFETLARGYKILFEDAKLKWEQHGAQIMTGTGASLTAIAGICMARKGSKDEVRQAVEEANAVIADIQRQQVNEQNTKVFQKKQFKLVKAKAQKVYRVGKHFWKEGLALAVGEGLILAGQHKNTVQKGQLAAGAAVIASEFAAYRMNVREDQGEAKDLEYLTGTKQMKKVPKLDANGKPDKSGEMEYIMDDDSVTLQRDPNAFKFWFSPETCPSLYSDNLCMTIDNLKWVENTLTQIGRTNGHIFLNDMRREFGGLTPRKMDHPLGGIFGKVFDPSKPDGMKAYKFGGWRDDVDFLEGRKVGTWIIFECDPEPIITKINKKLTSIETGR